MTGRLPFRCALGAGLVAMLVLTPLSAQAAHRTNTTEVPGATAVAAAIGWSQATFAANTASHVVIGRDDRFPDNLAGALLQGALSAPLLLNPSSSLHGDVADELERLGAKTVHLLGGDSAIAPAVAQALQARGYSVHRHAGPTRVDTAISVAREHGAAATTAIVSRAFGSAAGDETQAWADALAAGAWAADQSLPVLLTETDKLSPALAAYLPQSAVQTVLVVGGAGAVSDRALTELRALGLTVERIAGVNRFDTAVRIAQRRGDSNAGAAERVVLAEGQAPTAWAGGFTAAAWAARFDAPVVLANHEALPPETNAWLSPGGASTQLRCGPFTEVAACDSAGQLLNQSLTGQVTLTTTELARDGKVAGRVEPTTDVTGVSRSGGCVTTGAVTLDANGAFSIPLANDAQPGECVVTFAVTHKDDRTVNQAFTLTLSEEPSVTIAPELLSIETVRVTAGDARLRYVFDDTVIGGSSLVRDAFALSAPDGRRFTPMSAPEAETGNRAVVVDFRRADYDQAILAAVDAGAAKNVAGQSSVAAQRPLKERTVTAGHTDGPDLLSARVTAVTAGGTATVELTFDTPIASVATPPAQEAPNGSVGTNQFRLVTSDGLEHKSTGASENDSVIVTATFDHATFAGKTAAQVQESLRRAATVSKAACAAGGTACTAARVIELNAGTVTGAPDLLAVTLDVATNRATYTFDEQIQITRDPLTGAYTNDARKFQLHGLHPGGAMSLGQSVPAIVNDSALNRGSVTVAFTTGAVSELVTGATVSDGAVLGISSKTNAIDGVGFGRVYAAGAVDAPKLTGVTVSAGVGSQKSVTLTFDRVVAANTDTSTKIVGHTANGATLSANGSCVITGAPSTNRQIRCDFNSGEPITVVSVSGGAVDQGDGQVGGIKPRNSATNIRPAG